MARRRSSAAEDAFADELDKLVAAQESMSLGDIDDVLEGILDRGLRGVSGNVALEVEVKRRVREARLRAACLVGSDERELLQRYADLCEVGFTDDDQRSIMTLMFGRAAADVGSHVAHSALEELMEHIAGRYPAKNKRASEIVGQARNLLGR